MAEVKGMPVAEFEGAYVREMVAALPGLKIAMPEGYPRGTHLQLQVEARIRNVRYDEIGSGDSKGELKRVHVLAYEDVKLLGAYDADEFDPGVGGSAAATKEWEDPWVEPLLSWLRGDNDSLDFDGHPIPDRLHTLLQKALQPAEDPGF